MTVPGSGAAPVGAGEAVPSSPAQGMPTARVTITLGVVSTVPPPPSASGSPVPWAPGWLVILNSSPFTLIVSTGGAQTTQIAAFTSDRVYVFNTGAPVTLTPVAGSQTALPGQDSSVYATWYKAQPPGTYPAALGSGAAQFSTPSAVIPLTTGNLNAGANQDFGTFSSSGFAGLALRVQSTGLGPLRVEVYWIDAGGANTFSRIPLFTVPSGGFLVTSMPVYSRFFFVRLFALAGVNTSYAITAVLLPVASNGFLVLDNLVGPLYPGVLVPRTSTAIAAGATTTIASATYCYSGEATLMYDLSAFAAWELHLQIQDWTGGWADFLVLDEESAPRRGAVHLELPPAPVRVQAVNLTGTSRNAVCAITTRDAMVNV